MSFEGEFASYEPLRRIMESKKVSAMQKRFRVLHKDKTVKDNAPNLIVNKTDLHESVIQPDLILSIDGSNLVGKAENGFPGAEFGYVTIASVLIDLKKIEQLETQKFIDPVDFRETEKADTIESVFPGCNVILDSEKDAVSSVRKVIFEEFQNSKSAFEGCETLLETYEYLFKMKREKYADTHRPKSPTAEGKDMEYGYGIYECPHTHKPLYSTDALRLHELLKPEGTSGELYGQIMSTMEKLWLVNLLRSFEKRNWLPTLRRIAFILDGPLAVFSTSSWLTKVISDEIIRINEKQKKINDVDLFLIGIEKTGVFFNHFTDIDTDVNGTTDLFAKQSAMLLDDSYIKKHIIFNEASTKPYGQDTYFGRKFFYKTKSGQRIVPVVCCFNANQKNLKTARPDQFPRLGDIMALLDKVASSRYPNSISPLVSAHAEAAIPLNLGKRLFEAIAKEIREQTKKC